MKAEQEIDRLNRKLRDGSLDPEEPLFVLRASDILAAATVDGWADLLDRLDGMGNPKVAEARRLAVAMKRWPRRKVPGRNITGGMK